jgi:hypothetical protein
MKALQKLKKKNSISLCWIIYETIGIRPINSTTTKYKITYKDEESEKESALRSEYESVEEN